MVKTCAFCEKTDGMCYTSNPPKIKCTITGRFHEYGHICDVQITNADRIRAMTDDELADWMYNGISTDPCDYCQYNNGHCDGSPCRGKADAETIIEWLKRPAEGE